MTPCGTAATREFYEREGWDESEGTTTDRALFGTWEDGPIRQELSAVHRQRILEPLRAVGDGLNLLECGCGGNPEPAILPLCAQYTGTDFSGKGLGVARQKLSRGGVQFRLRQADACDLPYRDGEFDAVYSAHMIYHIDDPEAQRAALREMMRVLRPGGVLVLVAANPRPWLLPHRALKRMLAERPAVARALNAIRGEPPLPYRPMPIAWTRSELEQHALVDVMTYAIPSQGFHQRVSEHHAAGRAVWSAIRAVDRSYPRISAYLGTYVIFTAVRRARAVQPDDRTRGRAA